MKSLKSVLLIASAFCATISFGYAARGDEWKDPNVNGINRLPMHTDFFAYESRTLADAAVPENSRRFMTLNGMWKFSWVEDADKRPTDFYATDYEDTTWDEIPVPGLWQLHGYGDPLYVNIGYAWRNQFPSDPPAIPTENNNVGSYRRIIDIPESWKGNRIIAHFGSVTSNMYLWVNGEFVGYSEDSKLEAEFDITDFVRPGKNLFAFQVFRWCDGTYLEDQDFWRYAGVGRDCYLYARPVKHVADVRYTASLDDTFTKGRLDVTMEFSRQARGCTADVVLADKAGRQIVSHQYRVAGTETKFTMDAGSVDAWSAEQPNLYDLTVTLSDADGDVEVIPF